MFIIKSDTKSIWPIDKSKNCRFIQNVVTFLYFERSGDKYLLVMIIH